MGIKKKKRIAVFGGSFNPPHTGHFDTAAHIYKKLGVDEVWLMLSTNRFKDVEDYAPLKHRRAMTELLIQEYPHVPIKVSDIEQRVKSLQTYDILKALEAENPDCQFIWIMGADNLTAFHKWGHADEFIKEFPIAVIERGEHTAPALDSKTAHKYASMKKDPKDLIKDAGGWCVIDNPGTLCSSTGVLKKMRAGERKFSGVFQKVADYIIYHRLYGINPPPPKPPFGYRGPS